MRAGVALLVTMAVLCPIVARAQSPPPDAGESTAIAQVVVNDQPRGDAWLLVRGDDVWMPVETLRSTGLRWDSGDTIARGGESLVSLRSIRPTVRFTLDPVTVQLVVAAPPEMFAGRGQISIGRRVSTERPRPSSAFVNYAMTTTASHGTSWSAETALRAPGGLLDASWSRTPAGTPTRGPITFTHDDEARRVRWTVGDGLVNTAVSGAAEAMIGLVVGSEFSIDPQFTSFAPVAFSGTTAVPAVADVYVNGQLVARADVAPGAFDLRDVPVPIGAGDVRVVLRDQFGRQQDLVRDYYRSPGLLSPGLHAFRYAIGAQRIAADGLAWRYGAPAASFDHRVGVSESLTAGLSGAWTSSAGYVGGTLAARLPLGELSVDTRVSRVNRDLGGALATSWTYRSRRVSGQVSAQVLSASVRAQAVSSLERPPSLDTVAAIDVTVGRGVTIGGRYRTRQGGLSISLPLSGRVSLSASAWRGSGASRPWTLQTALTVPIARRTSATLTSDMVDGRMVTQTSVQRPLDLGPGLGYSAHWQTGLGPAIADAAVQLQGGPLRVEVRRDQMGDAGGTALSLSGSVVAVDRTVRLARPVTDAFALVRVDGVPGVRTYISNQYVGRTSRAGDLIVPTLASYAANRLSIDDRDLPIDAEPERTDATVAPALRGAGVVPFRIRRSADTLAGLTSASTVRTGGEFFVDPAIPLDGATARVQWLAFDEERVPVGADGRFEFVRAAIGHYRVELTTAGGVFLCSLTVSSQAIESDGRARVGRVPCASSVVTRTAMGQEP